MYAVPKSRFALKALSQGLGGLNLTITGRVIMYLNIPDTD
jgi:hypothetical protein